MGMQELDYRFRSKMPRFSEAEPIVPPSPPKNRKSEAMKENWRKRREAAAAARKQGE